MVERCYADRGYRGHGVENTAVFISGRRRGMTPQMKGELKRRSAIEPVIGQMKAEGKLDRNYLAGELGEKSMPCCVELGIISRSSSGN